MSFWLSSGVRTSELLGLRHGEIDVGGSTITVISKGSRPRETVPASVDSFLWLALYLREGPPMIEGGPVWWTRQGQPRPLRPLPVLAIDPAQLPRLEEMTTNAENRLAEAHTKAWLGEVAALEESLIHPRRRHDEAIVKLGSAQMASDPPRGR